MSEFGIESGSTIAVAFSGGCDSSALMHSLLEIAKVSDYNICAVHINHCLRGEESDSDELFVKSTCKSYGIELYSYKVDVMGECAKSGESTELCARRLRYEIFDKIIAKGWYVATAHTASDNAETVLFNLARGTGVAGLCGIPRSRGKYIRPLIDCTRDDVELYCQNNGLQYVTDSTNLTDEYTRNFIRHNIIPRLKEVNPSFESTVLEMTCQMRDVDNMLNEMAITALDKSKCVGGYSCAELQKSNKPVMSRAVRIAVKNATGRYPDSKKTAEICNAVSNGGRLQLFNGWYASAGKVLKFYQDAQKCDGIVNVNAGEIKFGNFTFNFEIKTQPVNNLLMKNAIDCDKISNSVVIRCRKAGDSIKLKGRPTKQIRKLMNEMQIPNIHRDAYPLICDDEGVLFVCGCGVAERALPDSNTKKMIIITYKGENNAQG